MNVNDEVWVQLNVVGRRVFDDYHWAMGLDPAPYRQMHGLDTTWQHFHLWELMHIFGPECCMGATPPFERNEVLLAEPAEAR